MIRPAPAALFAAIIFLSTQPAPGQPAKGKDADLTPEQVAKAHQAVTSFGCAYAGYGEEDDKRTGSGRWSWIYLPKDPADYARELYFNYAGNRLWTAYALRFPARAADGDVSRLALSLRRLPYLKAIDLGGTNVTDVVAKSLADVRDVDALFLDDTAFGDAGLKELDNRFTWLDLSKTQVTDKGMADLARSRGLRALRLANNPKVTDVGLMKLTGLANLRSLDLSGTGVSLAGDPNLSAWRGLTRLDLSRTPVDDGGVKALAKLTSLEELDLSGTSVTGTGLAALASLPKLRVLRLTDAPVTDAGAAGIGTLKQLRVLHVNNPVPESKSAKPAGKVRLSDSGLKALGGCAALRELNLARTAVKGEGFEGFAKHAHLRDVDLDGSAATGLAFVHLREVPNLRGLNLARTPATGDGMHLLAELPYLSRLSLEESKANDEGMHFVFRLKALRDLNIAGTAVTSAGIKFVADNTLVQLNLANSKVDAQAVKALSGMKGLRALYVHGAPIAGSASQLKSALPDCTVVSQPPAKLPNRTVTPPPRLPVD